MNFRNDHVIVYARCAATCIRTLWRSDDSTTVKFWAALRDVTVPSKRDITKQDRSLEHASPLRCANLCASPHILLNCNMNCTVQRSDQQQFLYETTVEQLVSEALASIAAIHNLRQRITKLKLEGAELAKHGPAKKPDQQGIDTYAEGDIEKGEHYCMDPTGRRTGNGARSYGTRAGLVQQAPPPGLCHPHASDRHAGRRLHADCTQLASMSTNACARYCCVVLPCALVASTAAVPR